MTCRHDTCDRPARSRGLCENHYRQQLRTERTRNPKDPAVALAARRKSIVKAQEANQLRARERLDELLFLLEGGEWPPRACERLDWSISAAVKAARRYDIRPVYMALEAHRREDLAA